jgi:hypothetical protein
MNPISTSQTYMQPRDVLNFVDWRQLADLSYDGDGPRPTRMSLLDVTRDSGYNLQQNMLAACGEAESALVAGARYLPTDLLKLAQMTPPLAGALWLKRFLSALTLWSMAWHREPLNAEPKQVPGAFAALDVLNRLRQGETILPFIEAAGAGAGPQTVRMPQAAIVEENYRVFPTDESPFPRNARSPWGR